jgi:cell wall-associated NlpC family hydrolase
LRPLAPLGSPLPTRIAAGDAGVIAVGTAAVRRAPDHVSELVNQLWFGETVRVLRRSRDGKWLLAESADAYKGWIRGWSVAVGPRARVAAWDRAAGLVVTAPWWWGGGSGVGPLPRGARLAAEAGGGLLGPCGGVRARPAGGGRAPVQGVGRAASAALRPGAGARAVRAARTWSGVAYLWGGRTPAGLDCSALVQLAAAEAGVRLARDARLQCAQLGGAKRLFPLARALSREKLERPAAGDLWFFGPRPSSVTHVAMSLGGLDVIHAYGRVCTGSLDPASARFEPELFTSVLGWGRLPAPSRPRKFA